MSASAESKAAADNLEGNGPPSILPANASDGEASQHEYEVVSTVRSLNTDASFTMSISDLTTGSTNADTAQTAQPEVP